MDGVKPVDLEQVTLQYHTFSWEAKDAKNQKVSLFGSWDDFEKPVAMQLIGGSYEATIALAPGSYRFFYSVDGAFQINEKIAFETDDLGRTSNTVSISQVAKLGANALPHIIAQSTRCPSQHSKDTKLETNLKSSEASSKPPVEVQFEKEMSSLRIPQPSFRIMFNARSPHSSARKTTNELKGSSRWDFSPSDMSPENPLICYLDLPEVLFVDQLCFDFGFLRQWSGWIENNLAFSYTLTVCYHSDSGWIEYARHFPITHMLASSLINSSTSAKKSKTNSNAQQATSTQSPRSYSYTLDVEFRTQRVCVVLHADPKENNELQKNFPKISAPTPSTNTSGRPPWKKSFTYSGEPFDEHGLLYWLGTNEGNDPSSNFWENPVESGKLGLEISHAKMSGANMKKSNIVARHTVEPTFWGGSAPLWFSIDLGAYYRFSPNYYTLRHGHSSPNSFICDWCFQASHDGLDWTTLHFQLEPAFSNGFEVRSFPVPQFPEYYRYFRILQKGNYSMIGHTQAMASIEAKKREEKKRQEKKSSSGRPSASLYEIKDVKEGEGYGKKIEKVNLKAEEVERREGEKKEERGDEIKGEFNEIDDEIIDISSEFNQKNSSLTSIDEREEGIEEEESKNNDSDIECIEDDGKEADESTSAKVKQQSGSPFLCIAGFEMYGDLGTVKQTPHPNLMTSMSLALRSFNRVENEMKPKIFEYSHNFDTNGILYYLGTNGGTETYANPSETGAITVNISHEALHAPNMSRHNIVTHTLPSGATFWGGSAPQYFIVDLHSLRAKPTAYTLRHGYAAANSFLREWEFAASNDAQTWHTLHTGHECPFNKGFDSVTWDIERKGKLKDEKFRFFRVLQRGNYYMGANSNSPGAPYMCISGFELYGELTGISGEEKVNFPRKGEISQSKAISSDSNEESIDLNKVDNIDEYDRASQNRNERRKMQNDEKLHSDLLSQATDPNTPDSKRIEYLELLIEITSHQLEPIASLKEKINLLDFFRYCLLPKSSLFSNSSSESNLTSSDSDTDSSNSERTPSSSKNISVLHPSNQSSTTSPTNIEKLSRLSLHFLGNVLLVPRPGEKSETKIETGHHGASLADKVLELILNLISTRIDTFDSPHSLELVLDLLAKVWKRNPQKSHSVCTSALETLVNLIYKHRNTYYNILRTYYDSFEFVFEKSLFSTDSELNRSVLLGFHSSDPFSLSNQSLEQLEVTLFDARRKFEEKSIFLRSLLDDIMSSSMPPESFTSQVKIATSECRRYQTLVGVIVEKISEIDPSHPSLEECLNGCFLHRWEYTTQKLLVTINSQCDNGTENESKQKSFGFSALHSSNTESIFSHSIEYLMKIFSVLCVFATPLVRALAARFCGKELGAHLPFPSMVLKSLFASKSESSTTIDTLDLFDKEALFKAILEMLSERMWNLYSDALFDLISEQIACVSTTHANRSLSKSGEGDEKNEKKEKSKNRPFESYSKDLGYTSGTKERQCDTELLIWAVLLLSHLTKANNEAPHFGSVCKSCQTSPIRGIRYRCVNCVEYDLCYSCEADSSLDHDDRHVFVKIDKPLPLAPTATQRSSSLRSSETQEPLIPYLLYPDSIALERAQKNGLSDCFHPGVSCGCCGVAPIFGVRYKCAQCESYNLCETCEAKAHGHFATHLFLKLWTPLPQSQSLKALIPVALHKGFYSHPRQYATSSSRTAKRKSFEIHGKVDFSSTTAASTFSSQESSSIERCKELTHMDDSSSSSSKAEMSMIKSSEYRTALSPTSATKPRSLKYSKTEECLKNLIASELSDSDSSKSHKGANSDSHLKLALKLLTTSVHIRPISSDLFTLTSRIIVELAKQHDAEVVLQEVIFAIEEAPEFLELLCQLEPLIQSCILHLFEAIWSVETFLGRGLQEVLIALRNARGKFQTILVDFLLKTTLSPGLVSQHEALNYVESNSLLLNLLLGIAIREEIANSKALEDEDEWKTELPRPQPSSLDKLVPTWLTILQSLPLTSSIASRHWSILLKLIRRSSKFSARIFMKIVRIAMLSSQSHSKLVQDDVLDIIYDIIEDRRQDRGFEDIGAIFFEEIVHSSKKIFDSPSLSSWLLNSSLYNECVRIWKSQAILHLNVISTQHHWSSILAKSTFCFIASLVRALTGDHRPDTSIVLPLSHTSFKLINMALSHHACPENAKKEILDLLSTDGISSSYRHTISVEHIDEDSKDQYEGDTIRERTTAGSQILNLFSISESLMEGTRKDWLKFDNDVISLILSLSRGSVERSLKLVKMIFKEISSQTHPNAASRDQLVTKLLLPIFGEDSCVLDCISTDQETVQLLLNSLSLYHRVNPVSLPANLTRAIALDDSTYLDLTHSHGVRYASRRRQTISAPGLPIVDGFDNLGSLVKLVYPEDETLHSMIAYHGSLYGEEGKFSKFQGSLPQTTSTQSGNNSPRSIDHWKFNNIGEDSSISILVEMQAPVLIRQLRLSFKADSVPISIALEQGVSLPLLLPSAISLVGHGNKTEFSPTSSPLNGLKKSEIHSSMNGESEKEREWLVQFESREISRLLRINLFVSPGASLSISKFLILGSVSNVPTPVKRNETELDNPSHMIGKRMENLNSNNSETSGPSKMGYLPLDSSLAILKHIVTRSSSIAERLGKDEKVKNLLINFLDDGNAQKAWSKDIDEILAALITFNPNLYDRLLEKAVKCNSFEAHSNLFKKALEGSSDDLMQSRLVSLVHGIVNYCFGNDALGRKTEISVSNSILPYLDCIGTCASLHPHNWSIAYEELEAEISSQFGIVLAKGAFEKEKKLSSQCRSLLVLLCSINHNLFGETISHLNHDGEAPEELIAAISISSVENSRMLASSELLKRYFGSIDCILQKTLQPSCSSVEAENFFLTKTLPFFVALSYGPEIKNLIGHELIDICFRRLCMIEYDCNLSSKLIELCSRFCMSNESNTNRIASLITENLKSVRKTSTLEGEGSVEEEKISTFSNSSCLRLLYALTSCEQKISWNLIIPSQIQPESHPLDETGDIENSTLFSGLRTQLSSIFDMVDIKEEISIDPFRVHPNLKVNVEERTIEIVSIQKGWRTALCSNCMSGNSAFFFEVKILKMSDLSNIIVGVCEAEHDLSQWIGQTSAYKGWSYHGSGLNGKGYTYHDGAFNASYGKAMKEENFVGVFVDLVEGSISFYLNQVFQGIAYTNLTGQQVYPAVSLIDVGDSVRFEKFISVRRTDTLYLGHSLLARKICPNDWRNNLRFTDTTLMETPANVSIKKLKSRILSSIEPESIRKHVDVIVKVVKTKNTENGSVEISMKDVADETNFGEISRRFCDLTNEPILDLSIDIITKEDIESKSMGYGSSAIFAVAEKRENRQKFEKSEKSLLQSSNASATNPCPVINALQKVGGLNVVVDMLLDALSRLHFDSKNSLVFTVSTAPHGLMPLGPLHPRTLSNAYLENAILLRLVSHEQQKNFQTLFKLDAPLLPLTNDYQLVRDILMSTENPQANINAQTTKMPTTKTTPVGNLISFVLLLRSLIEVEGFVSSIATNYDFYCILSQLFAECIPTNETKRNVRKINGFESELKARVEGKVWRNINLVLYEEMERLLRASSASIEAKDAEKERQKEKTFSSIFDPSSSSMAVSGEKTNDNKEAILYAVKQRDQIAKSGVLAKILFSLCEATNVALRDENASIFDDLLQQTLLRKDLPLLLQFKDAGAETKNIQKIENSSSSVSLDLSSLPHQGTHAGVGSHATSANTVDAKGKAKSSNLSPTTSDSELMRILSLLSSYLDVTGIKDIEEHSMEADSATKEKIIVQRSQPRLGAEYCDILVASNVIPLLEIFFRNDSLFDLGKNFAKFSEIFRFVFLLLQHSELAIMFELPTTAGSTTTLRKSLASLNSVISSTQKKLNFRSRAAAQQTHAQNFSNNSPLSNTYLRHSSGSVPPDMRMMSDFSSSSKHGQSPTPFALDAPRHSSLMLSGHISSPHLANKGQNSIFSVSLNASHFSASSSSNTMMSTKSSHHGATGASSTHRMGSSGDKRSGSATLRASHGSRRSRASSTIGGNGSFRAGSATSVEEAEAKDEQIKLMFWISNLDALASRSALQSNMTSSTSSSHIQPETRSLKAEKGEGNSKISKSSEISRHTSHDEMSHSESDAKEFSETIESESPTSSSSNTEEKSIEKVSKKSQKSGLEKISSEDIDWRKERYEKRLTKYRDMMGGLQFDEMEMSENEIYVHHHYRKELSEEHTASASKLRWLTHELGSLASGLPLHLTSSVFVRIDASRLDCMKVGITGPSKTPYECGLFIFDVYAPKDYPREPPRLNLETTGLGSVRFNPNLYNSGKVCLSLLGTWPGNSDEMWRENESTLLQVFISIQSLILVDEPFYNEPGYESKAGTSEGDVESERYNETIRAATLKWAILEHLKSPPKGFEEIVSTHFALRRTRIRKMCEKWLKKANDSSTPGYAEKMHKLVSELEIHLSKLELLDDDEDDEEEM